MNESPNIVQEVFLNPGEIYFGSKEMRIKTLLGSCVSIILWHPTKLVGGMCHYLLPHARDLSTKLSGNTKYGADAFNFFLDEIRKRQLLPKEFSAKIFGGANMFLKEEENLLKTENLTSQIGKKNIEFAKMVLKDNEIKITSEDVGGILSRKVYFTVWDGEVWVEKK